MKLRRQLQFLKAVWKDPRTPWYAKAVLAATVGYALSPIDLIPDFIPVVGYLDDLVIVPLGLLLAWLLVPREVWREHRTGGPGGPGASAEADGPKAAPHCKETKQSDGESALR